MNNEIAKACEHQFIALFSPSSRLLSTFLFAVVTSTVTRMEGAFVALAFSLVILALAKIPLRIFLKRFFWINVFVLFLWLLTPWMVPGSTLVHLGPLKISKEGIDLCTLITVKVNALFFVFISMVSTLSFSQLAQGLLRLRLPDKIVTLILFTSRGIDVLGEQYTTLKESAALRGFVPKTDLHTYKTYASFIAILFLRASLKSEVLTESMQLRGFNGKIHTLKVSEWHGRDTVLVIISVIVVIAISCFGYSYA